MSKKYGPVMRLLVGKPSSGSRLIGAGCSRVCEGTRQGLGKSTSIHSWRDFQLQLQIVWAPYGNHWRHVRKICSFELFSPKRLETFRAPRTEQLSLMIKTMFQDGFKARMNKAKGNLDSFQQTFLEFKKSKLMQQKIQKKPQAAGTNEVEHADEEQQFDPQADFVDVLMAHNLLKMGLEISQRIL
ncbi:unnamed protein product [Sphagnum balticum]